jgi:hypothetical protein
MSAPYPLTAIARSGRRRLEGRDSAAADPRDPRHLGRVALRWRCSPGLVAPVLADRPWATPTCRWRRHCSSLRSAWSGSSSSSRASYVASGGPSAGRRPRGALGPLPREPAQRRRVGGRVAHRDSADPRVHLRAGAARDRAGAGRPGVRAILESDAGKAFLDGAFGWYGFTS